MKTEVEQIIGRRISSVIIKAARDRKSRPQSSLFLVFDDGTYFEFYAADDSIKPTGGVDRGGLHEVLQYLNDHSEVIFCATKDPDGEGVSHQVYGVYNEPRNDR